METIAVITIGYNHYSVDPEFLPTLLAGFASGKIRSVEKKYIEKEYKAVPGKAVDVAVENLEVITDRDAQIAELKDRLKKLEVV